MDAAMWFWLGVLTMWAISITERWLDKKGRK